MHFSTKTKSSHRFLSTVLYHSLFSKSKQQQVTVKSYTLLCNNGIFVNRDNITTFSLSRSYSPFKNECLFTFFLALLCNNSIFVIILVYYIYILSRFFLKESCNIVIVLKTRVLFSIICFDFVFVITLL